MSPIASSEAGIAFTYVSTIGNTEQARAITASSEAECRQVVQAMQQEIRNVNNLNKLEEYWTNQYRTNIERFGEAAWGDPNPNP